MPVGWMPEKIVLGVGEDVEGEEKCWARRGEGIEGLRGLRWEERSRGEEAYDGGFILGKVCLGCGKKMAWLI